MKILHIATTDSGGAGIGMLNILKALLAHWIAILFLIIG